MKQIFLFLLLLITFSLSAQRQLPFYNTAAGTLTQIAAGSGYVDVRINYSDQTGMTTGSTLDNTCVLLYFNTDESIGYELPITSVVTASSTNPVVRVNITGFPALNGAINGQGIIYKKTSSTHFAPFVSNASNSLQQVIQEAVQRDLNSALIAGVDVTKYVGSGVPAFTPTTNEPKLAQGLSSPYPFYAYNGTAWVLVGSGGSSGTGDTTRTAYKYATMKWADSTALHADNKVFKDTLIGGRNILLNNYPTMDASGIITNSDLLSKYDAETGVYQKIRADTLKSYIGGWSLGGNASPINSKLGTTTTTDFSFIRNNTERMKFQSDSILFKDDLGVTILTLKTNTAFSPFTTSGSPRLVLGSAFPTNIYDDAININRSVIGSGSGTFLGHSVRDQTKLYNIGVGGAYGSFDAQANIVNVSGTAISMNHINGFQYRPDIDIQSGSTIGGAFGYTFQPNIISGTVSQAVGLDIRDYVGSGVCNFYAGVYVPNTLSKATSNYVIYSAGTTPSYHAGLLQLGGNLLAAGSLQASNFYSNAGYNSVSVGNNIPNGATAGFNLTNVGYGAGQNLTANATNKNTLIGAYAGNTLTTGGGNTFLGVQAGFTTNGSNNVNMGTHAGKWLNTNNSLVIDNQDRINAIGDSTQAIIFGRFDANVSNQKLQINAATIKLPYLNQGATTDSILTSASGVLKRSTINDMLGTTTSSLRIPRLTTTQRNALNSGSGSVSGDLIYNTTEIKYQVADGLGNWVNIITSGVVTQEKVTGVTGTTITFTTNLPSGVDASHIKIWKNGAFQDVSAGGDYTVSSTSPITLTVGLAAILTDKYILRIE